MDRRISGAQQARIQPAASPTGASGSRQTRLMVDPNFDIFSKGMDSAIQGAAAIGQQRQEDKRRGLVKASTKVKGLEPKLETYYTEKPQAGYSSMEELYASDEDFKNLWDSHFGDIEDPEIRAQAEADARSGYNLGVSQRVAERDREERLYDGYQGASLLVDNILAGDKETVGRDLNNLVSFLQGDAYNLSNEDIGAIFVNLQKEKLEQNPNGTALLAEALQENKDLPPTVRAELQTIQKEAMQLSAIQEKQLKSEIWRKEIVPMLQADGLEATLNAYEAQDEQGSKWASYFDSSQIRNEALRLQNLKKDEEKSNGLVQALMAGRGTTHMAWNDLSPKDERKAVAEIQQAYMQTPEYKNTPDHLKADALENHILDLYKDNQRTPQFAKEILNDSLYFSDKPYTDPKQLPAALKDAMRLAAKLHTRGELHQVLGDDGDGVEWVALTHMTRSGMGLMEAVNNLITVKQQGEQGFKPVIGEDRANLFSKAQSELGVGTLSRETSNRLTTLYRVYQAKIGDKKLAMEAAVERVAQTTMKADGITYSDAHLRRNGQRIEEDELVNRLESVKSRFIESNPQYKRDDLRVTPQPGGTLAVTDIYGNILVSEDPTKPSFLYPNQFLDPAMLEIDELNAITAAQQEASTEQSQRKSRREQLDQLRYR